MGCDDEDIRCIDAVHDPKKEAVLF